MIAGAAAVLGLAPRYFREARPPERATVLSILPPENATSVDRASVSPDGQTIAFVAASKTPYGTTYLRSLDSPVSRALKGANDAGTPFWSPDGRSLAFTVFRRICQACTAKPRRASMRKKSYDEFAFSCINVVRGVFCGPAVYPQSGPLPVTAPGPQYALSTRGVTHGLLRQRRALGRG